MKPTVDVRVVHATEDDASDIEQFLWKYFFPDEPLNSSLQRLPEEIPFLNVLKDRLCFKAVTIINNTETLLGVVLNKELPPGNKKDLNSVTCEKQRQIIKVLTELDNRSKIWDIVNNEKHFNIVCVAVNNSYRGLGLGKKLVAESLKLAQSLGHKYVSIECSSFYSAQFAVEMGFELLAEIPYDEYLDENGEQIFKTKPPHKALKKLIKRLN